MKTTRLVLALAPALALTACSSAGGSGSAGSGRTVTVTNCGKPADFPSPPKRMLVNDGSLVAYALALGADDQVVAVSSMNRDRGVLGSKYGTDRVARLKEVDAKSPNLEKIVAQQPDVMLAGWNYGFSEAKGTTPDVLRGKGIAPYLLTESCRSGQGKARGTVDPWQAVRDDLKNLGTITGHTDRATSVSRDMDRRLGVLGRKPKPATPPTVFVFDSAEKEIFSSGRFGGPDGVIRAAGGRNALADVSDTWTSVSWERLTRSDPDVLVFVDYPPQTFEQKKALLRRHPAARNLTAVKKGRFLNLPYAMWTSGPLNIDAAERLRQSLEGWSLVPRR